MTPEEIKEYNKKSQQEFERENVNGYLGYLIPFILFWTGLLTPFFTDKFFVWMISLVPFYTYSFILAAVHSDDEESDTVVTPAVLSLMTSICLALLLFVVPENWTTVNAICKMGLLNVFGSLIFLFSLVLGRFTHLSVGMFLGPLFVSFHDKKKR